MKTHDFETTIGKYVILDINDFFTEERPIKLIGCIKDMKNEDFSKIMRNGNLEPKSDNSKNRFFELLKIKGISLYKNPIIFPNDIDDIPSGYLDSIQEEFDKENEKTFYNPYIFELV